MDASDQLKAKLVAMSDLDLLALLDEAERDDDMDKPSLPLRRALWEQCRSRMVDSYIQFEAVARYRRMVIERYRNDFRNS